MLFAQVSHCLGLSHHLNAPADCWRCLSLHIQSHAVLASHCSTWARDYMILTSTDSLSISSLGLSLCLPLHEFLLFSIVVETKVFALMMMASATRRCQMFMRMLFPSTMNPTSSHRGRTGSFEIVWMISKKWLHCQPSRQECLTVA